MSTASPICLVNSGSSTDGVNVGAGTTVVISLASTTGVDFWSIQCVSTDETSDSAAITSSLVIDPLAKTATFTAPSPVKKALIFSSIVNNSLDGDFVYDPNLTATFGIYVANTNDDRVLAVNERNEGSAMFGWVTTVNNLLRGGGGGGGGGGTLPITTTSATTLAVGDVVTQDDSSSLPLQITKWSATTRLAGKKPLGVARVITSSPGGGAQYLPFGNTVSHTITGISSGAVNTAVVGDDARIVRKPITGIFDTIVGVVNSQGNTYLQHVEKTSNNRIVGQHPYECTTDLSLDCAAAIQQAIDDAALAVTVYGAGAGKVRLPSNRYRLDRPLFCRVSGIHLEGEDRTGVSLESTFYIGPTIACTPYTGLYPSVSNSWNGHRGLRISRIGVSGTQLGLNLNASGAGWDLNGLSAITMEWVVKPFRNDMPTNGDAFLIDSSGGGTVVDAPSSCFQAVFSDSSILATINGATNASPIVISTTAAHTYSTGDEVNITGVLGNTAANGLWTIIVIDATHFSLTGSTGNGAYTSGGTANKSQKFFVFQLVTSGGTFVAGAVNHWNWNVNNVISVSYDGANMYTHLNGVHLSTFAANGTIKMSKEEWVVLGSPATKFMGEDYGHQTLGCELASMRVSSNARYNGSNYTPVVAPFNVDGTTLWASDWDNSSGSVERASSKTSATNTSIGIQYLPVQVNNFDFGEPAGIVIENMAIINEAGVGITANAISNLTINNIRVSTDRSGIVAQNNCFNSVYSNLYLTSGGGGIGWFGLSTGNSGYNSQIFNIQATSFYANIVTVTNTGIYGKNYLTNGIIDIYANNCTALSIGGGTNFSDEGLASSAQVATCMKIVGCTGVHVSGISFGQAKSAGPLIIVKGLGIFSNTSDVTFDACLFGTHPDFGFGATPGVVEIQTLDPRITVVFDNCAKSDFSPAVPWVSEATVAGMTANVRNRDRTGTSTIPMADVNVTITREPFLDRTLIITGAWTADRTLTVPALRDGGHEYFNNTTGAHNLLVKATGGAVSISVAPGARSVIYFDQGSSELYKLT